MRTVDAERGADCNRLAAILRCYQGLLPKGDNLPLHFDRNFENVVYF
ncbi:hypothetical protein RSSM_06205 [Rhodopirellula sallentina SM41]|uniref:Uncharacterized protein n=1 Tax=Rhodopirellula sallentina SM41 TaxID=1263870 RepID=M5TTH6_9BACT|nr:hypothetical protein RSSM_06205 [Rhodopirellula sallentina SM41]